MQINSKSTIRKYWQELRHFQGLVLCVLLAVVGGAATGSVIPVFVKRILDTLTAPDINQASLTRDLAIVTVLQFLGWGFWRGATFVYDYVTTSVIARLTNVCFAYLHKHSFTFFNSNFVGSLTKRVNYFTRAFESLVDQFLWSILPLLVDFTIILFVLFKTSLLIGTIVSVWIVVFFVVNYFFTNYKTEYDLQRSESETKSTGLLADTFTNQSNVKLFVGYQREIKRFGDAVEKVRRLRRFTWDLNAWFEAAQGFLTVALNLAILFVAVDLSSKRAITIGDFVLLQTYLIMIFDRVWGIGRVIRTIYTELADANEMTVMLDTPHEVQDVPGASALVTRQGEIAFKDVDFFYHETRKIFENFNLTIAPKEKVAFVGPSGAGKSTVVKLLLRMHDVTKGEITIDGQPINKVSQESLWGAVSLVPQDPILFHRTLKENIRYGKPDATDEEVVAAAKLAHCDEFISEFPDKYETYVGERGVRLSGGERQRVAIARAILRNAPILVLDEATSSLDSESEHLIQDALAKLMENKTVIVIAHRLSTIMKMDRIVVIERGAIKEQGAHNELLALPGGLYKDLWKLQAGGFMVEQETQLTDVEN